MASDTGGGPELEEPNADAADFEGDPIVGRTVLTIEDFTVIWAVLPQNRRVFVRLGLWALLVPLFWIVHTTLIADDSEISVNSSWPLVGAVVFVTFGALAFGLWRSRTTWARNAVADLRGAEGVEFRFDSQGFSVQAPGRQFTNAWSALYRCIETTNAFAIYTSPIMVMVVPKRAFAADEQTRLRARLLRHIPNRQLRGANVWRPLGRTVLLWFVLVIAFLAIWQFMSPK